jgi:hypothetical protein
MAGPFFVVKKVFQLVILILLLCFLIRGSVC